MSEQGEISTRALAWFGQLPVAQRIQRAALALLRRFAPVLRWRDLAIVTRLDDVRAVLADHGVFSVRRYGVRMRETAGDFLLGHDDLQHERERVLAGQALSVPCLVQPQVFNLARTLADAVVQSRVSAGDTLDVVKELADTIPVQVVETCLGVPNPGGRRLLEWVQDMSWYIFNPLASEADRERGVRAGKLLREHVDRLILQMKESPPGAASNALEGLFLSGAGDEVVAATICGLVAGALGPPPRQFVRAVDRLLDLKGNARERLHLAASGRDELTLTRFLQEASRFGPEPSIIYRTCEEDHAIDGRKIAAGTLVLCMIGSALMDDRPGPIERPEEFRLGRDPTHQMIFGHGLHACIGQAIGLQLLAGMAQPLFALSGLRRVSGHAGRIRYGKIGTYPAQNYPQHLLVSYERKAGLVQVAPPAATSSNAGRA